MVDLLTTILSLPEATSPFEQKILQGEADTLFDEYKSSIDVAQDLASDLTQRPEANPSMVRSMVGPVRSSTSQLQTIKNSLSSVDNRVHKMMSENINLARVLVAIGELQRAQSEADPDAIEQAETELAEAKQEAKSDLAKLHPDVKASMRYRLQFLRKWKDVAEVQLDLCDVLIACLTEALRKKAGMVGEVDRQIQKLLQRGGSIVGPDGRRMTLRDLLPESAEELREMIGVESEEMEQLIQQREEMQGTVRQMEEAETVLEEEINQRGLLRMKSSPLTEEQQDEILRKHSRRMVYRERMDDRDR